MSSIGSGFFISFNPGEEEDEKALLEFLESEGYSQSGEGIKKFLIDTITDEPEPEKKRPSIVDAIHENPELVQAGLQGLMSVGKGLLNAKIFKK